MIATYYWNQITTQYQSSLTILILLIRRYMTSNYYNHINSFPINNQGRKYVGLLMRRGVIIKN